MCGGIRINPNRTTPLNWMLAILLGWGSLVFLPAASGRAADPPGPDRVTAITVKYTAYTWWMATWNKNQVVCSIIVDHDGTAHPRGSLYQLRIQPSITPGKTNRPALELSHSEREGYHLYLVRTESNSRKQVAVTLVLRLPCGYRSTIGFVSGFGTNIRETIARLVLKGQEPLPNEHILRVEGMMDGQLVHLQRGCRLELAATDNQGVSLRFWAWSSYGDSSQVFSV